MAGLTPWEGVRITWLDLLCVENGLRADGAAMRAPQVSFKSVFILRASCAAICGAYQVNGD
jgi:hypothetical protein